MKRAITIFVLLVASGCATFADSAPTAILQIDVAEKAAGIYAATDDITKGIIRYEIAGQPMQIDQEIKHQALSEYGIIVEFSGCRGSPRIDFSSGYRETVINHLTKKYGFNPVIRIQETIRQRKMRRTSHYSV
jgi:hypothetical protein